MKLIVGLGNPGRDYIDSRHNVGFLVVKALAKAHDISFKKSFCISAFEGRAKINGQNILLAMRKISRFIKLHLTFQPEER